MPYPSTVKQLEARITKLASDFNAICSRTQLNHPTHQNRKVSLLRIGTGVGDGRPRVLITAGVHAREWAPPDAVLTLLEKLLAAYTAGAPARFAKFEDKRNSPTIIYREFKIDHPNIKRIIERTELYVIPLANPDGRAFSMPPSKVNGWRKNMRPAPAGVTCPPLPAFAPEDLQWVSDDPRGVDINRNFNFAFADDFYSVAAETAARGHDICDMSQIFHGPTAGSEPETKNIQDTLTGKNIQFFIDVHSFAAKFLMPWALAENQDTDHTKTFKNTSLDRGGPTGGRDPRGTPPYKEWVPPLIIPEHQNLGDSMAEAILDSTGYPAIAVIKGDQIAADARNNSLYTAVQAPFQHGGATALFYSGTGRDFAFSQQIGAAGSPPHAVALAPVLSFTFECGRKEDGGFQPHATNHYPKVEREVAAALVHFLKFVGTWRAPVPPPPPPAPSPSPPPTPPPPASGESPGGCFVATAVYQSPIHPQVQFLRALRDVEFKQSVLGRRVMKVVELIYYSFSPQLAEYLAARPKARKLIRLAAIAPLIGLLRRIWKVFSPMQNLEERVTWFTIALLAISIFVLAGACGSAYFLFRMLTTH